MSVGYNSPLGAQHRAYKRSPSLEQANVRMRNQRAMSRDPVLLVRQAILNALSFRKS